LNTDSRGLYLGEFSNGDKILAVNKKGEFYTTDFDLSNRYQGEILLVQKFDPEKIFTALYFDNESKCYYLKRFTFEASDNKVQSFISESEGSFLHGFSSDQYPQVSIIFAGKHQKRDMETIDAQEFIASKSYRAKGKRVTTFEVGHISFVEPLIKESIDNNVQKEPPLEQQDSEDKDISPTLF